LPVDTEMHIIRIESLILERKCKETCWTGNWNVCTLSGVITVCGQFCFIGCFTSAAVTLNAMSATATCGSTTTTRGSRFYCKIWQYYHNMRFPILLQYVVVVPQHGCPILLQHVAVLPQHGVPHSTVQHSAIFSYVTLKPTIIFQLMRTFQNEEMRINRDMEKITYQGTSYCAGC
jgi:hypothetical protein